jgi:hypothetical protein
MISENWTAIERALIIAKLEEQLKRIKRGFEPSAQAFDIQERIQFLRNDSASFLENNRHAILRGNIIPYAGCVGEPQSVDIPGDLIIADKIKW